MKIFRKSTLGFLGLLITTGIFAQPSYLKSSKRSGNSYEVLIQSGKWVFSLYDHQVIKATFTPAGSNRNEQVSDAVLAKNIMAEPSLHNDKASTKISWPNGSSVSLLEENILFTLGNKENVTLLNTIYTSDSRGFRFSLKPGEMIFGTGERSIPLNRRGYKLPLNNSPAYGYSLNAEALNFCVPFVLSNHNYAIFFDNPSKGFLDIGKTDPGVLEYTVGSGELSFYVIPGKHSEDILEHYHSLVGTQPLPPRWALGSFMSRFGYRDEKQTREIMGQMLKDSMPFDAVIFDLFWFGDSIKNTMGNLSWINKKAWPDPKKMITDFKKQKINTILITEPFVLNTSLQYDASKKFHATDSTGKPFVLQDFYFGQGGIIDIFRKDAQQWFWGKYKNEMDNGVEGWWGDLGEPEKHPKEVFHNLKDLGFSRPFAADEVHNIYGHYWSKMLAENFKKSYPNRRLFHLNRSGYAGSPRYSSFPWSGDISRSWDGLKAQLPLMQGMSLSGIPYIHSDAGGFAGGDGDAELYIRWLQFAAFTPIFRPHGAVLGELDPGAKYIPSEPALWPEPTKSLAKIICNLRYAWMPYNYTLGYEQTRFGKPLMKPMFFLNEKDSNLYNATDQYMWGDHVMVVPVTDKGQSRKTYYIPEGKWTNIFNLQVLEGPGYYNDTTISLNVFPVYCKEGSFIPSVTGMINSSEYYSKILNIVYFPSEKKSEYQLYEDDGQNPNAIKTGQFELISFNSSGLDKQLNISIQSNGGKYAGRVENRKMVITIPNLPKQPTSVTLDGKTLPSARWSKEMRSLQIPLIFSHKKMNIQLTFE
ncbi:MAG TPA: glycoside hydrolase family 31 protein [Ferruginibacter sp.]|nr:glycoside hydrolase family 31 protein [Ferruginibacter sp.]